MAILGPGFFPLRLVAFIASMGCFVVIFQCVRAETHSVYAGFVSAGLYAATFRLSGAWFDIGRVDSLALFLLLAGMYLLRQNRTGWHDVFAGIVFTISFFTKQSALVVVVPMIAACIVTREKWRKGLFVTTFVLLTGCGILAYDHFTHGWFSFYTLILPTHHRIDKPFIWWFWADDILKPLHVVVLFAIVFLGRIALDNGNKKSGDTFFHYMLFAGMVGSSWMARTHSGGYNNVLMTAYAGFSIFFGLGLNSMIDCFSGTAPENRAGGSRESKRNGFKIVVYAMCIYQFGILVYNPSKQIPTNADIYAGEHLIRIMRAIQGEILLQNHGYYNRLAGKPTHIQSVALWDIMRCHDEEVTSRLKEEILQAIRQKRFAAIILDKTNPGKVKLIKNWRLEAVKENYKLENSIFTDNSVFWTRVGMKVRPLELWVPKLNKLLLENSIRPESHPRYLHK